jgi:hypothetical protein
MLKHEDILRIFDYNPETGVLLWRERKQGRRLGSLGSYDKDGYLIVGINYNKYPVHHIAWMYVKGVWPKDKLDHFNQNKSDNRISNLREATNAENMRNVSKWSHNTSGLKGVSFHNLRKKYRATIKVNGKAMHLGLFECPAVAHFEYQIAANIHHGEFARAF